MTMKRMTNLKIKMKSFREHRSTNKVIDSSLSIENTILQIQSRLKNCRYDAKQAPGNVTIKSKIKNMEDEIERLQKQLKIEQNTNGNKN